MSSTDIPSDPPSKEPSKVGATETFKSIMAREQDLINTICSLLDGRPNHRVRAGHFTNRGKMARQVTNLDGTFMITVECLSTAQPRQ